MTAFKKYLLFQIPGWALAVLLLVGFRDWLGVSSRAALVLLAIYVAKDFLVYPFVKRAYEPHPPTGAEEFIGERCVVKNTLDPQGYVRVRGELWKARLDGEAPAETGEFVFVRGWEGITLLVAREPAEMTERESS